MTAAPLHTETGYLRAPAPGRVEWVLAHPTGLTEIPEGRWSSTRTGWTWTWCPTEIGRTGSAKEVMAVARSIHITGDTLTTLRMAAVGRPQHHLSATLHRLPV